MSVPSATSWAMSEAAGADGESIAGDAPVLALSINGEAVSDPAETFPVLAQIFEVFVHLTDRQGGRFPDVTVMLVDDLHAAMAEVSGEPGFTGERLGGMVAGKTVKTDPQWAAATVILAAGLWPDGEATPIGTLLLCHEFTHALLGGLRKGEGWCRVEGDNDATFTARAIAVECIDEIRADCFADGLLRQFAYAETPSGEIRPATTIDLLGGRSESVLDVISTHVHPAWPDLVTQYRTHQVDLGTLWSTLASHTEQALLTMAHTDAEHFIDEAQPTAIASAAEHPGMVHYLGPVWHAIALPLRSETLIPTAEQIAQSDIDVGAAGETAILAMWAKLGVTAETVDGGLYLHVTDPDAVGS